MKILEATGQTVGSKLVRKNPFPRQCNRDDCMPCRSHPGTCMRQGVVYVINCGLCKEDGVQCDYIGESARTSFDRGQDHLRSLRTGYRNNALVLHME